MTHPSDVFECPECHARIPIGKSVYKHSLGCLNLKPVGVRQIQREYGGGVDLHSQRVMLAMAEAERRGD